MNLVLFDLDNTLLAGDSDFAWAQFLIGKGVLDREVQEAKNIEFYEQYKAGTLDIFAFLDFQLAPLARHPREQLDAWHSEFMTRSIRPMITPKARTLVREHLDSGALVAVVTATNAFVTGLIQRGQVAADQMKEMYVHSIRADEAMSELGVSSKLNADWDFLVFLRDRGREEAGRWLAAHFDAIGNRSSVDVRAEFL